MIDYSLLVSGTVKEVDITNTYTIPKEYFENTDVLALNNIKVERKIYQDSTFKATVSGPRIGEYGPNLDDINIYSRTETRIIEKPYPFLVPYVSFGGGKNILGIGGGITIKQRVDIGAKYLRVKEKNMFLIEANIRFNK